jgi:hypothetical protein
MFTKTVSKVLALLILVISTAKAAENLTVAQVVPEQHRAAVRLSAIGVVVGDSLLATRNGQQCALQVISVSNGIATLNTAECSFEKHLTIGQALERSLISEAQQVETITSAPVAISAPSSVPVAMTTPTAVSEMKFEKPILDQAVCARKVNDIIQMPCEGRAIVAPILYMQASSSETDFSKAENSTTAMGIDIEYGLSNRWSVGVDADAGINDQRKRTSKSTGIERNFDYSGFTNPWLRTQYKLQDQAIDSFDLAVSLGYSPDVVTAKSATLTTSGTMGTGGQRIQVDTSVARKIARNEFAASIGYTYLGVRTIDDEIEVRETGGNTLALTLSARRAVSNNWFASASIIRKQIESTKTQDEFDTMTYEEFGTTTAGAGLSKYFSDSSFKWFVSAEHVFMEDRKTSLGEISDRKQTNFTTGLNIAL